MSDKKPAALAAFLNKGKKGKKSADESSSSAAASSSLAVTSTLAAESAVVRGDWDETVEEAPIRRAPATHKATAISEEEFEELTGGGAAAVSSADIIAAETRAQLEEVRARPKGAGAASAAPAPAGNIMDRVKARQAAAAASVTSNPSAFPSLAQAATGITVALPTAPVAKPVAVAANPFAALASADDDESPRRAGAAASASAAAAVGGAGRPVVPVPVPAVAAAPTVAAASAAAAAAAAAAEADAEPIGDPLAVTEAQLVSGGAAARPLASEADVKAAVTKVLAELRGKRNVRAAARQIADAVRHPAGASLSKLRQAVVAALLRAGVDAERREEREDIAALLPLLVSPARVLTAAWLAEAVSSFLGSADDEFEAFEELVSENDEAPQLLGGLLSPAVAAKIVAKDSLPADVQSEIK